MKAQGYFYSFLLLLIAKIFILLLLAHAEIDFLGGGNDSEYYHEYAIGNDDLALNAWPLLLRVLNEASFYSRDGVSHFLKLLAFLFVPLTIGALCRVHRSPVRSRVYWSAALVASAYPTIIYFTTDIYREVFMLTVWLCGVFLFKALSEKRQVLSKILILQVGVLLSFLLYTLRPYLGVAYFVALIVSSFYSFRSFSLLKSLLLLTASLFVLYLSGFLEPLLAYRALFAEQGVGGSTLGIGFTAATDFFPDLLKTTAFQLFGLYFPNMTSALVFIMESLPFLFFFSYLIINKNYSNKFVDYLIVFFVVYSCIWLLGNDNLGTAIRLRIFNYISVVIAFFIVYQNKRISLKSAPFSYGHLE